MDLINYYKHSIKSYFFNEESLDYINEKVSLGEAVLGNLFLLLVYIIVNNFILEFNPIGSLSEMIFSIIQVVSYSIGIVILYGIIFLLLKLFGGQGNFKKTLIFGLSNNLILLIMVIFSIILNYLPIHYLLFIILFLIPIIWSLIIQINIFSIIHKVSKLKSFFAVITPVIITIIILFFFIFLLIMAIASLFNGLYNMG